MSTPSDDWTMVLAEHYPLALKEMLHPSGPPHEPLALFRIQCGEGWKPLLIAMLERLEAEIAAEPVSSRRDLRVVQIKEKFGTLRVYLSSGTARMLAAIAAAQEASRTTCELCSAPGHFREINAGMSALCDSHARAKGQSI